MRILNVEGAPVKILEAKVADKGSARNKSMTGIFHDFSAKVVNTTNRDIMAFRLVWTLKLPFQSWVQKSIETNSIEVLKAGATQTIHFKIDKHFRDDAYYYVTIPSVQFSDDEIWEAPENEETATRLEKVKSEIDSLEDRTIDDMTLEEIKHHMQESTNGAGLAK